MRSIPLVPARSTTFPSSLVSIGLAACVVLAPHRAAAQERDETRMGREHELPERADHDGPKLTLALDTVTGFRRVDRLAEPPETPEEQTEGEEVSPRERAVTSIVLAGEYDVTAHVSLGLRIPITTSRFLFTEADDKNVAALGNIEIAPSYDIEIARGVEVTFEVGAALPTASGDAYDHVEADIDPRRRAYANLAASRARGFRDNALFATHRFGVVPGAEIEYERGPVELGAFTKLETLIAAGGSDPPEGAGTLNTAAVESVSGAHVVAEPVRELLGLGLDGWLSYTAVGEVKAPELPGVTRPGRSQVVVEPSVRLRAGPLRSTFGVLLPIGGPLATWHYHAVHLALSAEL